MPQPLEVRPRAGARPVMMPRRGTSLNDSPSSAMLTQKSMGGRMEVRGRGLKGRSQPRSELQQYEPPASLPHGSPSCLQGALRWFRASGVGIWV